ncbi:MAG: GNAT family N-acetyltransferase [Ginsengibacter sp.]
MSLYTLSSNQTLPQVELPQGFHVEESSNIALLMAMAGITAEEVVRRLSNDHVAFVAYINKVPAAFGWMARGKAIIGELNHELVLPVGNRYLWNFRTMEQFRGRGIYPALLQYIIRYELEMAERFWIIHAPENKASLKGIQKTGFELIGKLYNINSITSIEATEASVQFKMHLAEMDIVVSVEEPASCWNCSSPYVKNRKGECCCTLEKNVCTINNLASFTAA